MNPPGTQALLGKLIQKSKAGGHRHLFGSGWRNWATDEAMWGSPKGSTRRIRGDFICICEFSHAHILNALRWARNSAGTVYSDKMSSDFPGNGESCHVQGLCCGVSVSPLTPLSPPPNHNTGRAHGGTCPDARVHFLGLLVGALGQLQAGLG